MLWTLTVKGGAYEASNFCDTCMTVQWQLTVLSMGNFIFIVFPILSSSGKMKLLIFLSLACFLVTVHSQPGL